MRLTRRPRTTDAGTSCPFSPTAAVPTEVLKLLVVLASFHLQVELVLIGAEMEEILAGLVAVGLEQVFNPI